MCKCDVCGKELTEDELFYFYTLKEITKPILKYGGIKWREVKTQIIMREKCS